MKHLISYNSITVRITVYSPGLLLDREDLEILGCLGVPVLKRILFRHC